HAQTEHTVHCLDIGILHVLARVPYQDLAVFGIEKSACTSLATSQKVRETRYFVQEDKVERIKELDNLVAQPQHEMHTRKNNANLMMT
ncbi:MAG: hypothetical protein ACOC3C_03805, partial [Candidatus Thorarchaeota archaeon]